MLGGAVGGVSVTVGSVTGTGTVAGVGSSITGAGALVKPSLKAP